MLVEEVDWYHLLKVPDIMPRDIMPIFVVGGVSSTKTTPTTTPRNGISVVVRGNGGGAATSAAVTNHTMNDSCYSSLQEECAALRQRVRELEDDQGSAGSGKTVDTETDSCAVLDPHEVTNLRKELNKVENDRAAMELDFMNQLSKMARDHAEMVERLQKQLEHKHQSEKELDSDSSSSSSSSLNPRRTESVQVKQLMDDLKAADKELQVNRKDVDELYKKVDKLEGQKATLSQRITDLQLEVDNSSKVISSLNEAMVENDKHWQSRIDKFQTEIKQKAAVITKQSEEMKEMQEKVVRVEGQKTMLLEEITDLRMQLDRNDDAKKAMKKKLDELKLASSGEEESSKIGVFKQAAMDAEDKAEEMKSKLESLENEMRSVNKSYKVDISRLEEAAALKESECEQAHKMIRLKDIEIKNLTEQKTSIENTVKELKLKLEGNTPKGGGREIASPTSSKRFSYQKHSLQSPVDDSIGNEGLMDKLNALERQMKTLEKKLAFEKETNMKLKGQLSDVRNQRPPPIVTSNRRVPAPPFGPPTPPTPALTPQSSYLRARSQSPSFRKDDVQKSPAVPPVTDSPSSTRSVKALAACFEPNKNATENTSPILVYAPTPIVYAEPEIPDRVDIDDFQRQVNDLESQLDDAKSQNEFLQKKLRTQCEQIGELHAEVAALSAMQTTIHASSQKEFDQERSEHKAKIAKLESDLVEARKLLDAESKMVEKLQSEIGAMTSERLAYEECTMDAFEKQVVKGQKSHQSELNSLKVELTKAQMKIAALEKEHEKQVKELEATIEELNVDCDKELEEKAGEVDMFKHKYEQQLDMVTKLEKEREQLCEQMKTISNSRREEIDELQSDLMDKSTAVTTLKRALQAIQMQVEHQTDNTKELEFLREKVQELESQRVPTGTALHMQGFEVEKLQEDNRKLKDQVRNITIERRSIQDKLNAVVEEYNAIRSQPQVFRERNDKLRRELARLTKKLEKIEGGGVSRIAI